MVALTFDDGPDERWTPGVLDALAREHATATFFVVGEQLAAPDGPALVRAIVEGGHAIQAHCAHHINHADLRLPALRADAQELVDALAAHSVTPSLWRPPYGGVNPLTSCRVANEFGMQLVLWTHDTFDYAGLAADAMLAAASPLYADSVILLHDSRRYTDTKDARATIEFVKRVVPTIRSAGYTLGPLEGPLAARGPRPGETTTLFPCAELDTPGPDLPRTTASRPFQRFWRSFAPRRRIGGPSSEEG